MVRNIIICYLIINTLVSSLMVPLIYLDFNIRRDYIAEVLCINKDEPITVCGGSCYLSLRLDQVENENDEDALPTSSKVDLSFYFSQVSVIAISTPWHEKLMHLKRPSKDFIEAFSCEIFRPPQG